MSWPRSGSWGQFSKLFILFSSLTLIQATSSFFNVLVTLIVIPSSSNITQLSCSLRTYAPASYTLVSSEENSGKQSLLMQMLTTTSPSTFAQSWCTKQVSKLNHSPVRYLVSTTSSFQFTFVISSDYLLISAPCMYSACFRSNSCFWFECLTTALTWSEQALIRTLLKVFSMFDEFTWLMITNFCLATFLISSYSKYACTEMYEEWNSLFYPQSIKLSYLVDQGQYPALSLAAQDALQLLDCIDAHVVGRVLPEVDALRQLDRLVQPEGLECRVLLVAHCEVVRGVVDQVVPHYPENLAQLVDRQIVVHISVGDHSCTVPWGVAKGAIDSRVESADGNGDVELADIGLEVEVFEEGSCEERLRLEDGLEVDLVLVLDGELEEGVGRGDVVEVEVGGELGGDKGEE